MRGRGGILAAGASLFISSASHPYGRHLLRAGLLRGGGGSVNLPSALRMSSSSSSSSTTRTGTEVNVAVIGAGVAGLACARAILAAANQAAVTVTLYEKSTSHGRCATREVPSSLGLAFDHGAPGFTAETPAFRAQVDAWSQQGIVAPLQSSADDGTSGRYYRGHPTMRSLPTHLASGLDVRRPLRIERLERRSGKWRLFPAPAATDADGNEGAAAPPPPPSDPLPATYFDAVVVAVPPEQTVELLASVVIDVDASEEEEKEEEKEAIAGLAALVGAVRSEPCITVLLAFPSRAGADRGGLVVRPPQGSGEIIAKALCRPRGDYDCWTVHTTVRFTERFIYAPTPRAFVDSGAKDAVMDAVLAEFRRTVAPLLYRGEEQEELECVHRDVQRWLYSQTFNPLDEVCGWLPAVGLGACGDGWAGGGGGGERDDEARRQGVERAWLSGVALGREVGAWVAKKERGGK